MTTRFFSMMNSTIFSPEIVVLGAPSAEMA
jgi:hypothetical protein